MLKKEGFKFLLYNLKNSDINTQNLILMDIKSKLNLLSSHDLQLLLEFLNTIKDIELEVKLFSLLSVCLALDDTHYEAIVMNNLIFEKIEVILSRELPLKTTILLNFLTLLVYNEDGESSFSIRKNLAAHARNMIRASGCLSVMITLFVNSMMFPDTWKALCRCLAECCRDCQPNKVHCAHLIPLCVQKCLQGFTDVLMVLQSIISDNSKNIENFLRCNGTQIFTRELMQYELCLQVLSTVIQSSKDVIPKLSSTDIPKHVSEILHWNGPHSQKGQWCTIILYYLNSDVTSKVNIAEFDNNARPYKADKEIISASPARSQHLNSDKMNDTVKNIADDTTNLFQNVVNEILYWKSKDEANNRIKPFINACMAPQAQTKVTSDPLRREFSTLLRKNEKAALFEKKENFQELLNKTSQKDTDSNNELSFSFLQEEQQLSEPAQKYLFRVREHQSPILNSRKQAKKQNETKSKLVSEKSVQTNSIARSPRTVPAHVFDENDDKSPTNSKTFKPTIMSTPKRKTLQDTIITNSIHRTKANKVARQKAHSYLHTKQLEREQQKKIQRMKKNSQVKKLTSRSMSARFMDAINESCTTLVKTVKDVFMTWKNTTSTNDSSRHGSITNKTKKSSATHSYSFINYMRKRDAILGGDTNNNCSFEINEVIPCKTCNDTTILKQKMASNTHLCETIKKLKMGINLYGCNFKKISKTFWPQDTYMTPTVLYGLYRKLILK